METLRTLVISCLLAGLGSTARANEWLRSTTAIDNQSKRSWTLEGRDLPASFIVATDAAGREETVTYAGTLSHIIQDGQRVHLRLADPTHSAAHLFTLRDHAGQAPLGDCLAYQFKALSTSCWTACCPWGPSPATLAPDWGLRVGPEGVLDGQDGQTVRILANQWPELKEPSAADKLISGVAGVDRFP